MAHITIIGGHGKIARRLASTLAARGDEVTAWVRNPDHDADVVATGATPLHADVETMSLDDMTQALAGADAVVWSAGAGGGSPERTYAVDRDAAVRAVDAATAAGVPRFVMVSYFAAGTDHGVSPDDAFYPYAEAKAAADRALRGSDLDWVVLGPSSLTDDAGTGSIETGDGVTARSVSRDDVAAVAAAVLATPSVSRVTVDFNAGDVPIAEALR